MKGIELITAERERQISEEGWTAEHDQEHDDGELAKAAACYLLPEIKGEWWPWSWKWWKPTPEDRQCELVKAGALVAAELDRVLSQRPPETTQPGRDTSTKEN